jgi:hypothetical protein
MEQHTTFVQPQVTISTHLTSPIPPPLRSASKSSQEECDMFAHVRSSKFSPDGKGVVTKVNIHTAREEPYRSVFFLNIVLWYHKSRSAPCYELELTQNSKKRRPAVNSDYDLWLAYDIWLAEFAQALFFIPIGIGITIFLSCILVLLMRLIRFKKHLFKWTHRRINMSRPRTHQRVQTNDVSRCRDRWCVTVPQTCIPFKMSIHWFIEEGRI